MTNPFNQAGPALSGGLAQWSNTAEDPMFAKHGGMAILSEMRKARKGYPYSVNKGGTTDLVFLSDVTIVPAFQAVTGWTKGGFPDREFFATDAYAFGKDGRLGLTGRPDIAGRALSRYPDQVAVASVLDTQSWTDKKTGETHPWSIRLFQVSSAKVRDRITQALSLAGQTSLPGAHFKVSRGTDQMASRLGDAWAFAGYLDFASLSQFCAGFTEADFRGLDLAACMPAPTAEQWSEILREHARQIAGRDCPDPTPDANLLDALGRGDLSAFGGPVAPSGGNGSGHTAPAPPGGFGQPAPAPAPAGGFGQPAPAPAPAGGFGQPAPAPAPAGGFGQPAPAPAGGFGQPAPAPAGGFGQPEEPSAPFANPSETSGLAGGLGIEGGPQPPQNPFA